MRKQLKYLLLMLCDEEAAEILLLSLCDEEAVEILFIIKVL